LDIREAELSEDFENNIQIISDWAMVFGLPELGNELGATNAAAGSEDVDSVCDFEDAVGGVGIDQHEEFAGEPVVGQVADSIESVVSAENDDIVVDDPVINAVLMLFVA
jgi:hypothetical protein